MRPRSERRLVAGPAGRIEVAIDRPPGPPGPALGIAWIGHPHPLYGGTLDNKVVATLARAFVGLGWLAVRPNFRGVGQTDGSHDHGEGETADLLHLIDTAADWLGEEAAAAGVALAGFSFGSFVIAQLARTLRERGARLDHLVLVGTAAGKWDVCPAPGALVVHGEHDETIPLAAVLDWARPQELPVVVLPGADHFFHRRLGTLKQLVQRHVLAASADTDSGDA